MVRSHRACKILRSFVLLLLVVSVGRSQLNPLARLRRSVRLVFLSSARRPFSMNWERF